MPYVTAVSSRELHGSRGQRHGLCTAHSKSAAHEAHSRSLNGRCLRPIARLVPSGPMGRMRTRAARLGATMQVRFTQVAQGAIFAAGRSTITRTITHGPKFTLFVLYFGRSLLVCRCDRRRRHWQRLPTRRAQFTALSRRFHGQAGGTSPGPSCMPAHIRPHARGAAWQLRSHAHDRHVLYIQYETHLSSCLGRWTPLDRVAPARVLLRSDFVLRTA